MSHQSIKKTYLEVTENDAKVTHIKVETYYDKGGINYFTGQNEARGIKLSVSPVTRTLHDGKYWSEGYVGFTGSKRHMVDMARYNAKKCENYIADAETENALIGYVCRQNNLILK